MKFLMVEKCFQCRENCGACCIAPSITSHIPEMLNGKPANVPCVHLGDGYKCALFGLPSRPKFCSSLVPSLEMCGRNRAEAIAYLSLLEKLTDPSSVDG